jgi:hypothetical protein
LERGENLITTKADGADLDDPVQSRRQAGGLEIKRDKGPIHWP